MPQNTGSSRETNVIERLEQDKKSKLWNETMDAVQAVREGRVHSEETVFDWIDSWGTENELPRPKL